MIAQAIFPGATVEILRQSGSGYEMVCAAV